jgi:hypothetical protein
VARRPFLARLIGDGLSPETAFRADLPAGINGYSASVPTGVDGKPLRTWALVYVDATDLSAVGTYVGVDNFWPGLALTTTWGSLTPTQQTRLLTAVQNRLGLNPPTPADTLTLRQMLRWIVRQLDGDQADERGLGA